MKRVVTMVLVGVLAFAAFSAAPAAAQMHKPGAEQQQLSYLAGTWKLVSDMKKSAFTAPGKMTLIEKNQWMPGRFFLSSGMNHTALTAQPFGKTGMGTAVWGYDQDTKKYTFDAFHSAGVAEHYTGTVSGDTWTFTSTKHANGKPVNVRYTMKVVSPTSYTYTSEAANADGSWSTIMSGTATKISG